MGRHTWGRAAAGIALAAAVVGTVSGCGGTADVDKGEAQPKPKVVSVAKARAALEETLDGIDCQPEPGACWEQMTAVMKPARTLRKAMNADKRGGPGFWTEAYALINKMEDGYAVGEDQGGGSRYITNRPAVFGSAHDLLDWLDEHPVE
ncbi:hypothetical protein AB0D71_47745 [Streptomyces avermitilis]|uniref:hypothetical protein n=1 Tax=Streptomyces avermitilis TaxID=33903 RepID=UPI0033E6B866